MSPNMHRKRTVNDLFDYRILQIYSLMYMVSIHF